MKNLSSKDLGWSDFFESQLRNISVPDFKIARVTSENKTNYNVRTEDAGYIGEVMGKLTYTATSEAELPKVGDWVVITVMDRDRAMIHEVLARRTVLARKAVGKNMTGQVIATNLDVLFIVQGLDNNFNIARIERYLTAVNNIRPVIVLNKADLLKDVDEKIAQVKNRIPGVEVIATSSLQGSIDPLRAYLQSGQTFAFVGSSGVGKSSLINGVLDAVLLKTSSVREKDSKGKHTTSRREMIFMDNGAILIDTPGMREFQPWSDQESVSNAFGDIQELAAACRFADCQHLHETGCAVKGAVEAGLISSSHYNNYLRLKREMAYQETLLDMNKARERKKFIKQQIKTYNKIVRKKRKHD